MALSAAELQEYFEDLDWESFNDLRIDDATIERDLAEVANHRLQSAFDAAQWHYLHGAPRRILTVYAQQAWFRRICGLLWPRNRGFQDMVSCQ